MQKVYDVIVVGGGHAGVEAAWSAANILANAHRTQPSSQPPPPSTVPFPPSRCPQPLLAASPSLLAPLRHTQTN
ncbi:MAG: FAD-dependent oxidoreductase, partial [bacterium]